jgi:putative tryptophan/tyrosine transport system ATP-binding protein
VIKITALHKTFNPETPNEVYALRGVDLSVAQGEFVTLIGTNGSGKSTLLNAIAGTFLPDSGKIEINGEEVTRKRDHQRAKLVSRVFQNPFLGTSAGMRIAENLHMAYLRGKPFLPRVGLNHQRRDAYSEAVRSLEMQLEGRLDNVIGTLSGGQRQALTLLMAVLTSPKVLLLDEHTAALDPKSASQVIKLTREFVERSHLTAVMVTHSMHQALTLGDRTVMMHQGQVIDSVSNEEKRGLTVEDLLQKFAELRKAEKLTDDMMAELRREYL